MRNFYLNPTSLIKPLWKIYTLMLIIGLLPLISKAGTISGTFTTLASSPMNLTCFTVDPTTGYFYGQGDQNSTNYYRYDPTANIWTLMAPCPISSGNNGGATYLNGKIYNSYCSHSNMTVYDIASNTWSTISGGLTTGNISNDGTNVYVSGGSEFKKFIVATSTWVSLNSLTYSDNSWGGLQYKNGFFYHHSGDGATNFDRYNVATNTWTILPNVPGGAVLGSAIFDAYYYCQGSYSGTNLYSYDLGAGEWNNTLTLPFSTNDAAIVTYNNSLYIVQGEAGRGFTRFTPNNPILTSIEGSAANYAIGDASFVITSSIVATQNTGVNFQGATITIASNFQSGKDVLSFENANGITGSWNSASGVLTLSGTSSIANYQAALRSVKYSNVDFSSNSNPRTISFKVYDGSIWSNTASRNINLLTAPSVSTTAASSVSYTTVTSGGNVTSNGGSGVTARGVCWNTTGSPTISDNLTTNGSGTGSFISSVTGLAEGTTYYLRAYATNSIGTNYGNQISFTTLVSCTNPTNGGTISSNQAVCSGFMPEGLSSSSLPTGHIGTLEYKWQSSTTSSTSGFIDIASSNSASYSPGVLTTTTWYKRLARVTCMSNWTGAAESNVVKVTVNELPSSPTTGSNTYTYDGTTKTATANVGAGETVDWYANASGGSTIAIPTGTNVGTYSAWAEARNTTTGCKSSSRTLITLTITKATLTVTADSKTKVYGDDNPTLTFQYSGWKNNDDDSDLDIKPVASTTVTNTTSVGTYTDVITVSGGADNNYAFSYVPADFSITAATLTVTADVKTKVYGDDNPTLTFQYSGWKNNDDDSDLDIKPTASTTVTNTTSVGTYTDVITVSGGVDNNYAFSYVPADFKVTAATLTVTADAKTKVYGDDNPTLTFQYSGWKNNDDESDLDTKPTVSTTVTNTTSVGTYTDVITVSGGADNNYAFSYVPADFEVTAATLTVTADDKTKVYGDVNPALTFKYSGWKNSDDESDLDTKPTAFTYLNRFSNVRTYTDAITISGGLDNNYVFSYVPANLTVTKATLLVTADNQTKAYGQENPVLTFQYSGWKNNESQIVLNTKPTISTTVTITTAPGVYENVITLSGGADNNYDFTYVSASFTVNKGKLVIWLDQKTKNYGDENPTLTYRYTGFMNGDDESDLDYIPYPSTSVTRYTNAGTYISSITMTGGLDDNYYIVNVPANFIVNKAPLTVKADNKTKAYGENNPDLTVTYSGWKNGESEAVLDVKPVVSTTVNATTLPGVYPNTITAQAGSDNNYRFEYVAGTFTVTQASQSIIFNALAPKTYGDEPFILSATSNSDLTISYTCTNSDVAIVSGNTVNIIGAGTAVITASQSGDSNYLPAATVSQTLTVNRKPLFVAGITAASKIYDGNANAVLAGGTLSGTINSDVITLNNATSGTFSQTSVGTEIPVSTAMTISGDKVANYVLSLPNLKADITPKVIAVTAKNSSRTCDQPEQALSYSFEPSLVGTDTFTGTLTRTVGNTPEVYPILQGTLSLGTNYSINFTGASYTITNTKNLAPTVDQPSNLTVLKNSKEVTVTLTGIDPVSNCMAQDIESIVATADNKNLIPEIVVDYTKGQPTAKLKLKIADGLNGETTIHVKLKDNGGTENSGTDTREISFNIKVEIPVGVEDLTQNFDVRVYPNPSKGLIKIETSGFNRPSVRIFKVTGEEIMKKMNLMDPIETMDLGGNAPGIYFVEISDQTNTITKKLILKN